MARTVELGGRTFDIKAGPLSIFYFHEEFGNSIMEDYARMTVVSPEDAEGKEFYELLAMYDWPATLRITWALAKTAFSDPNSFEPFNRWIAGFDYLNMGDHDFFIEVLGEATRGLFRTRDQAQKHEEEREKSTEK